MSVITLTIKTKMYKLLYFFFAFQRVLLKFGINKVIHICVAKEIYRYSGM